MTDVNRRLNLCENLDPPGTLMQPRQNDDDRLALQQKHEQGGIDLAVFNGFEYNVQNSPSEYEQAVIYLEGLDEVKSIPLVNLGQSLEDKLTPDVD